MDQCNPQKIQKMPQIIDGGFFSEPNELTVKAYSLFPRYSEKVDSFRTLAHAFGSYAAKLWSAGWAPLRADEPVNQLKDCLLEMDPDELSIPAEDWRVEMTVKWYALTFEYLLWTSNGLSAEQQKEMALHFAMEMLTVRWYSLGRRSEHEDRAKLARLWLFLTNEDIDEAEKWVELLSVKDRKLEGLETISRYKSRRHQADRYGSKTQAPLVA